jgi:mannose-6-phosphate isomerase
MNNPLRFHPYLRPMVWGGQSLRDVLGKPLPTPEPYGEAWEISDHASHQSVIVAGEEAGRSLRELMMRAPDALLGSPSSSISPVQKTRESFPWLVKFLDACDWLSVQVHPDDETVAHLWPGEGGKTEAWFVLAAQPASRVYAGLLPGVDERHLRGALANGTVAECLHQFEPRPGDCLFLPAGTVHAVGGGVLIAEVQQTSDATFRLFDWNRVDASGRSRQLHIEEAMACIDWKRGPVNPVRASGYPSAPEHAAAVEPVWQHLVDCRYFQLDYVRQNEPFRLGGRMQILIVLHGSGTLMGRDGPHALNTGDTMLLPASLAPVWCQPEDSLGLLLASLPARQRMAA